ncbi:quinolinate synthase [bacterium]|nr:MAG: quinolinate synthase [bacterium]
MQTETQSCWTPLPDSINELAPDQVQARITAAREKLGQDLLILGHHYQANDVIRHTDATGDSFKLAQYAQQHQGAKYVVFCGVHFMAESADILTDDDVTVVLPDMGAGCSMADMAGLEDVEEAFDRLQAMGVQSIVPITYMNSTAAIKDFCGRNGGIVCTSSNAGKVLQWAFERGERVMFFPDQHLGRNTAFAMGIGLEQMPLWDPAAIDGGAGTQAYRDSRLILWKGHCSVHMKFDAFQIARMREADPELKVIVHPECNFEVVQSADLVGSTEFIIKAIEASAPGSKWAIGTEYHLVTRLAEQHPDKEIFSASGIQCACSTMYRIDPPHLLWALENLVDGEVVNPVRVRPEVAKGATVALERMLALRGDGAVGKRASA